MSLDRVWAFPHRFFTFFFVGTAVPAEWNARAARAALLDVVARSSPAVGFGSLPLS